MTIPPKCRATLTSHMACTLSHLFTIFSAWQAGLVRHLLSALQLLQMQLHAWNNLSPAEGWAAHNARQASCRGCSLSA